MADSRGGCPFIVLGLVLCSIEGTALAQKPTEEGRYEVELLTIEPGDDPTTMFGHSAIRVMDRHADTDLVYNWGTLEWAPDIPQQFISGPMTFFLSVEGIGQALAIYRAENRRVFGQGLDLTQAQATKLAAEVERNAQPDQRDYLYHHFYEPCAAMVRDVVDRHSGGALQRASRPTTDRTSRLLGYKAGALPPAWARLWDLCGHAAWGRVPVD